MFAGRPTSVWHDIVLITDHPQLSGNVEVDAAVVQSLPMQTDGSRSVDEFRNTFVGRLSALSRAQPAARRAVARR